MQVYTTLYFRVQNLGSVCNCLSYVLGKRLADPNFKFKSGKIKRMTTPEEEKGQNTGMF